MGKVIFNAMKKTAQSVRSAVPILLIALCILILVAIWWAGPLWQYQDSWPLKSVTTRVIVSVIFVLFCMVVWGMVQWRALQKMRAKQEREEQRKVDPHLVSIERQETELNHVMVSMKENLNKRNYLYALPWYLVLGTENNGKTSLINRSGQSFVFSSVMKASVARADDNEFHFDWWVGENAVLIDPNGELLTQATKSDKDDGQLTRRLWLHFIEWLERTRSRRPLNGVIVTLDVAKLAGDSASERKAYATTLRVRLRELMETLCTRMPVYIAVTKMDLLDGFEAFFKHYPKSQRDDVLGFTFSFASVNDFDKWLEEFDLEYGKFVQRIDDSLSQSLIETVSSQERQKIYSFTRQLAGMREIFQSFLVDAFGSDQFSTSALVRGVYFTSVFQQGVPSNPFALAASKRYGLREVADAAQHAANSTVYFTHKLFSHIIYPEAGLASDNFKVTRRKRRVMWLTVCVCLVATALLAGGWHHYYKKNIQEADAVLAKVSEFRSSYSEDLSQLTQREMMRVLDTIRNATLEVGVFRDKHKYFADMGLYQGSIIGPKVEQTYLAILSTRFLPLLMRDLAFDLENAHSEEHKLEVLRVFRMMIDKSGRHKEYVNEYFSHKWQAQYEGRIRTQESLAKHLDYAMNQTDLALAAKQGDEQAINSIKPYHGLIKDAQVLLSKMPIEQRVYRGMKSNSGTYLGAPFNIKNQIGPVFDLVFTEREIDGKRLSIPRMLTKDGFENYFLDRIDSLSDLALIDSWVLGQSNTAQFSAADKAVLKDKIMALYASDYVRTWRSALNEIDVKYFVDINNAILVLDNITGNAQPFDRMLDSLAANTRLFDSVLTEGAAKEELLKSPRYKTASHIDKPFSQLNQLTLAKEDTPAYFDEVETAVMQLLYYLKAIQDSPDPGRAALAATRDRLNLSNADPIYALKRIASGLPSPLDNMMEKLADESWYVVKQEAVKHLEVRWQNEIYNEFKQKFANRYPFNLRSAKDVDLRDFEAFFAPSGTLARFYDEQLKMFVEEKVSLGGDGNTHSLLRQDVLVQFELAKKIQSAFFNRKGILDVNFSVEPVRLSANKRRAVLNIDGQLVEYSQGPRHSVGLIWPNTLRETAQSKVTLVPNEANLSPRSIVRTGPWSLFRLLDSSAVVGGSETSVDYNFKLDAGEFTFKVHSDASDNVFRDQLLTEFHLPSTLY